MEETGGYLVRETVTMYLQLLAFCFIYGSSLVTPLKNHVHKDLLKYNLLNNLA